MSIAVNLFLASPKSVTGAFVYIKDILPALLKADGGTTYHLLGQADTIAYFKAKYHEFPGIKYRVCDIRRDLFTHPYRALLKLIARIKKDAAMRERIIAREVQSYLQKERIDLYFSPSGVIYPRGLHKIEHVTTILDLQPEYFPQHFPPAYLEERRQASQYAVKHSKGLIAISEHTKKTLVEKYNAEPKKIQTIYFGPHYLEDGLTSIAFPDEFVFYPAAFWPHKNHTVLIKALGRLKDRFPRLHVVCTGVVKRKQLKRELELLAESEGIGDRILFPGFVSDASLRRAYKEAEMLVFPSSFEGFGIPLVEAFYFGLPVIAADNSSIPEVVGDAGLLVKTGDAQALANAIEKVLTDDALRKTLVRKGRERARTFSWEKAARETLAVFESVVRAPER